MSPRRVAIAWLSTGRELLRRRIVLLLFSVVPAFFYVLTDLTTSNQLVQIRVSWFSEENLMAVNARKVSIVFVGHAAVGLLSAFLAMNLLQRSVEATRRLLLCGFRSWEVMVAKCAVLGCVAPATGLFVAAMVPVFIATEQFWVMALGFVLCGWVYGCYGLLVGASLRHELEGVLCVVMLVNVDAAWLQNPVYYAEAHNTAVIRSLPAYFPTQVSLVGTFLPEPPVNAILSSLLYGLGLFAVALLVYHKRTRVSDVGVR